MQSIFLPMVQNAALLLALVIIFDAIPLSRDRRRFSILWRLLSGVLIGAICIAVMLTPWTFRPGLIFDSRSVLLCMSGLFFGGLPTLVAGVIAAGFRWYLGGEGALLGIGVIFSSGIVGVLWRKWRKWNEMSLTDIGYRELILFSLLTHLVLLGWMLLLPAAIAVDVISQIALPVLLLFPLINVLMGRILSTRLGRDVAQQLRLQDDFLFRSQFNVGGIGISISGPDKRLLKVNPHLCQMLGYSEVELLHLSWPEISHPEDLDADLHSYQRLLRGEIDHYEMDKRFFKKNGAVVHTHMTVACQRSQQVLTLAIASYLDITKIMEAQQQLAASHAELELVLASGALGYWVLDSRKDKVTFDAQSAAMLGCSLGELNSHKSVWIDAIYPQDRTAILLLLDDCLMGRIDHFQAQFRLQRRDGRQRWIYLFAKVFDWADGRPVRICGIHRDITEEKQQELSLKLAASVYDNSSEAMCVINPHGRVVTVNRAFSAITGFTSEQIVGRSIGSLKSAQYSVAELRNIRRILGRQHRWQGELWLRRCDGREIITWMTINSIDDSDSPSGQQWIAQFSDVTDKKHSEQVIWQQANYDPLTSLPNRRMLLEQLNHEIQRATRLNGKLALLFLDLDYFKEVNDTLGHDMGDQLLIQTAERLRTCVRESDFVARLGGDEFTLILTDAQPQKGFERVAEQILYRLSEPFQLGEETAYISASIGITLFPDDGRSADVLLKHADQAMYAAKEQGRNRFNYFTASMQQQAHYRRRLIQDLRQAVERLAFELCYQPIVELATGQVHKAEALLRWHHPQRGQVAPTEFIPLAEDSGLIFAIGNWVFRQALQQRTTWLQQYGIDIQISINKSPVQFRDEGEQFNEWLQALQQLPGGAICIEITERLLLDTSVAITDKLLAYRDAGVQVSLDDFGTGYSSLAYLKKFDIDYLKIDRSFTQNIDSDDSSLTLCEAIVVMAHKLGMKVIAEGVENQHQAQLLASIHCDYAQGFYYAKPMTASAFAATYLAAAQQHKPNG